MFYSLPAYRLLEAQDVAKPLVGFVLLSEAISHCQLLGCHRESTYRSGRIPDPKSMRRLFWTLYIFDKNTSLLFGRAPKIQDSEIDTEYPEISTNAGARAWDESFIMFMKLAKLHGQMYNGLFLVGTLKSPLSDRVQCVDRLSAALEEWKTELDSVPAILS